MNNLTRWAATMGVVTLLTACAGNGRSPPSVTALPMTCEQIATMTVPASAIGLPTRGAVVTSATTVAGTGSGPTAIGERCVALVDIAPVDTAAPSIRMQVSLPTTWNGKALMFGGGGYDGSVPPGTNNVPAGPIDQPVPLGRGYATFSSDSGHQAGALGSQDGSFGVNDEAVANFSGDALKKTRDVAVAIIEARYGRGPGRSYFAGGSSGGREALEVVQKWPRDWDGAIVLYPAGAAASLDLQFGRITRALAQPGAYPSPAKRKRLYDASLAACDGLDGVVDGLIGNVAACNARFDPATAATIDGTPLRCTGGTEGGDTCLSDPQIAAFNVMNTPITFGYPLASGETQYPGFNTWGTDFGIPNASASQKTVSFLALGSAQPASPMPTGAPYGSVFWDQWVRFFMTRDPDFDTLSLDPQNPGVHQARISALTGLQDVNRTDLSTFQAKGGKILMAHGMSDALVSPRATEQYYRQLQATMGSARVDGFVRFYEIPGYGHAVSTVFNAAWDSLTTLENWVERGTAPPDQVVADTAGVPGRTRPLCPYPAFPRYRGSGDVNEAASFACAAQ